MAYTSPQPVTSADAELLSNGSVGPVSAPVNGNIFFAVGQNIFKTDGTPAGTANTGVIRDPGSSTFIGVEGFLYYTSNGGTLFRTDGVTSPTQFSAINCGSTANCAFAALGDVHYVLSGQTLHRIRSDGQAEIVKTFPNGYSGTLHPSGNVLYILMIGYESGQAISQSTSRQLQTAPPIPPQRGSLWQSDGTTAGTTNVLPWQETKGKLSIYPLGDRVIVTTGIGGSAGRGVIHTAPAGGSPQTLGDLPSGYVSGFIHAGHFYYYVYLGGNPQSQGIQMWRTDGNRIGDLVFARDPAPSGAYFIAGSLGDTFVLNTRVGLWQLGGSPFVANYFYEFSNTPSASPSLQNFFTADDLFFLTHVPNTCSADRCPAEIWITNGTTQDTLRIDGPITRTASAYDGLRAAGVVNGRVLIVQQGDRPNIQARLWSLSLPTLPRGTISPAGFSTVFHATDFDRGDEGLAYHDREPMNLGGAGYSSAGVDVSSLTTDTAQFNRDSAFLSYTFAGEWLNYTIDVNAARAYTLTVQVASQGIGGTFHIELDGVDVAGPLQVPDTQSWVYFQTLSAPNIAFPSGRHTLRLVMDKNGATGGIGSFKHIALNSPAPFTVNMPLLIR